MNLFEMAGIDITTVTGEKPKEKVKNKKENPVEKYLLPLIVYYCGMEHQIRCEEYPEQAHLSEDELLHHLRENFGYRILTKTRCSFEYLKDSNEIIVYLKNPSKGSSYPKGINKVLFSDGHYRFVKKDTYGYLIGPSLGIDECNGGNRYDYEVPGIYLEYKVPIEFLVQIIKKFKDVHPYEFLAQIYFDRLEKRYILHFPDQKISENSILRSKENFFLKERSQVLFAEIHSHGSHEADFSSTDDENEVDFLVYGVIGHIIADMQYQFRLGFNGDFVRINNLNLIFDLNSEISQSA